MPEGFTKLENSFLEQMITRSFTRNQQNILRFIFRLSIGCNRPYALIPKLRFFEKCGVVRNRAKGELKTLAENKIITWNQPMNTYAINFKYQEWQIGHYKIAEEFDPGEYQELIHLQLTNRPHENNDPMVCEIIDKKITKMTKRQLNVRKYQPGNPIGNIQNVKKVDKMSTKKLTKCKLFKPASLTESKREGFPKDSIKDIKTFKDIKEQQNTANPEQSQEQNNRNVFLEIRRFWEQNIHFHPPDSIMMQIGAELDQTRFIDKEIILEALKEAVQNNAKAHWRYALKIIRTWEQAGIQTLEQLENYRRQEEQNYAKHQNQKIQFNRGSAGGPTEESRKRAAAIAELQRRERENVSQEQLEQWEREKQELLAQLP